MSDRPSGPPSPVDRGRRGSVGLYAAAFLLVVASAAVLGVAAVRLLASTELLWASIVLSVSGGCLALASLTVRRR